MRQKQRIPGGLGSDSQKREETELGEGKQRESTAFCWEPDSSSSSGEERELLLPSVLSTGAGWLQRGLRALHRELRSGRARARGRPPGRGAARRPGREAETAEQRRKGSAAAGRGLRPAKPPPACDLPPRADFFCPRRRALSAGGPRAKPRRARCPPRGHRRGLPHRSEPPGAGGGGGTSLRKAKAGGQARPARPLTARSGPARRFPPGRGSVTPGPGRRARFPPLRRRRWRLGPSHPGPLPRLFPAPCGGAAAALPPRTGRKWRMRKERPAGLLGAPVNGRERPPPPPRHVARPGQLAGAGAGR